MKQIKLTRQEKAIEKALLKREYVDVDKKDGKIISGKELRKRLGLK